MMDDNKNNTVISPSSQIKEQAVSSGSSPVVVRIDEPAPITSGLNSKPNKHKALLFLIMLAICGLVALAGVYLYYQRDGRALESESRALQEIDGLKQQIQQLEEALEFCGQDDFNDSDY